MKQIHRPVRWSSSVKTVYHGSLRMSIVAAVFGVRHKSGFCRFFTGNSIRSSATPASESPIPRCRGGPCGLLREGTRPSPTTGSDMKTHKYVAGPAGFAVWSVARARDDPSNDRPADADSTVAGLWSTRFLVGDERLLPEVPMHHAEKWSECGRVAGTDRHRVVDSAQV